MTESLSEAQPNARESGDMPPGKILKIRYSEIAFGGTLDTKILLHACTHFKAIKCIKLYTATAGYKNTATVAMIHIIIYSSTLGSGYMA